ncbi:MAG: glycyl-tRNA synthetase [Chthoniobacter sp.]|nr:glycyl-tRNA synthetase [Chthoniobacter sp.]
MSQPKANTERMEKIVSLCKRRGFVFQSSEIYGGLNGCWDYGPLGVELKRNLKDYWWRVMTRERDDIVGMDGSILMNRNVWKASGHEETFSDPMVDCLLTKRRFRADQIEPQSGIVYHYSGAKEAIVVDAIIDLISEDVNDPKVREALHILREFQPEETEERDEKCKQLLTQLEDYPNALFQEERRKALSEIENRGRCHDSYAVLIPQAKPAETARKLARQYYQSRGLHKVELLGERTEEVTNTTRFNPENGSLLTEPRAFNLMFKTYVGATEDENSIAYLRPETAQAIFVQFKNVLETSRKKLPFGIAQIGKAFRNEINPRNFTFRSREFEQMELEYFCKPVQGPELLKYWLEERLRFYENIGIPREKLHVHDIPEEERAFYSKGTYDIEFEFPFGIQELEGVAYRTDYDLTQHTKHSGKPLEYFDEETKERFVPHVIEPSAGVDRTVLALICTAYDEETVTDEKGKAETRIVLRFHPRIAPIKAGIFPLLKNNPQLVSKAHEVAALLKPHMMTFYDESGAIGRRYRRQDEAGTPFGITIDFDTLGEKGDELRETVTLRHRDSMQQERVKISELLQILLPQIS